MLGGLMQNPRALRRRGTNGRQGRVDDNRGGDWRSLRWASARHLLATEVQHLLGFLDAADEAASNGQPAQYTEPSHTLYAQNGISDSISGSSLMPPMRVPAMVSLQSARTPSHTYSS